jgi:hypothetical protein
MGCGSNYKVYPMKSSGSDGCLYPVSPYCIPSSITPNNDDG